MASPKATASSGAGSQLTIKNVSKLDDETRTMFQFRCPESGCQRVFWRRTEQYRPFAGCRDCKRRWKKQGSDPSTYPSRLERLEDHQMIGYAKFICAPECDNVFTNNRAMYAETQPCRRCGTLLLPSTDLRPPPAPRMDQERRPPRRHIHECSACITGACRIENMAFSKRHNSSASSVATMLTTATEFLGKQQGGLVDPTLDSGVYEVILKSNRDYKDPSEPFYCFLSLADGSGSQSVDPPPAIPE